MLDTEQRNRKISHLIESAVQDFCRLMECSYYDDKEGIMVQFKKEDLLFVFPDFHKDYFTINIYGLVYTDLTLSKSNKLKAVYKADEVAEYINAAGTTLWFLTDTVLTMSFVSTSQYSDYAILKSSVLLDLWINAQNTNKLKDMLERLLVDLEQVRVN